MDTERKYNVWIISDGAVGRRNQCLGVAERWNSKIDIIKVSEIKTYDSIKNYLEQKQGFSDHKKNWPDIILASGNESCEIALKMKSFSNDNLFIASTETYMASTRFDFMAINKHEEYKPSLHTMDDIIGVTHRVTESYMKRGIERWQNHEKIKNIIGTNKTIIGVLVGGDASPDYPFDIKEAENLAYQLNTEIKRQNAALLITNSPRITIPVWRKFNSTITEGLNDFFVHDCRQHDGNPYSAFLGISNVIAVTGDSISMCYEAASSNKPVYIMTPPSITPDLYKTIHQDLYDRGLAKKFEGNLEKFDISDAKKIDETGRVAAKIKELLDKHLSQTNKIERF